MARCHNLTFCVAAVQQSRWHVVARPLRPRSAPGSVRAGSRAGATGMAVKDGGEDEPRGLMPSAELRAALKKAGRKPASCVIGLTKDRQAVVLLDRLKKPRKLLGEAKAQAKAAGLPLDLATLRFGRVSVSGGSDSAQAGFTVNKPVAPAVQQAMRAPMRAAGHPRFTVNADPSLEDEADGPDEADPDGDGADLDGGGAGGGAAPRPAAWAPGGAATPAGRPQAPRRRPGQGTLPAPGLASGPPAGPGGASSAGSPDAALRARLTPLVKRVSAAVKSGQPGSERLLAAAEAAYGALRSGDLAAAGGGADALERLLGGASEAGPPPGSLPAAMAPATPAPVAPAPGNGGAGGAAARVPSPLVALRDVAGGIPAAVAADPSRAQPLARLLADARASAAAGDAVVATPKIEALRRAIAAPPADGAPGLSAGERTTAMQAGMDRARAGGTRGGVQVADAGWPPGTATDAGGSGSGGSGPGPPAGGPSLLGRVGGFLADHAPTRRQLYGVGETTVAAGGMMLSGIGVAAGVTETGVGVLATPAGGAGIPVAAGGMALTGASVALGGMSADLFGRGLNDMFSRRPPAASPPVPGAPAGAAAPGGMAAAGEDTPVGALHANDLARARVDPGLGGQVQRAMQDRMAPPGGSGTFQDGAGTTQVRLGGSAMSGLPPGLQGIQPDPGLVPPPPLSGQLPGFDIHPEAGRPTIVSTPPTTLTVPNHTGSPPPAVNLGDLREEFPALQPQGLTIMESSGPFNSDDPLVGDIANEIEAAKPGMVKAVNVDLFRPDGTKATDIDIQVDGAAIQVKSGSGAGLTRQMNTTKQLTGLRTIAYGPDLGLTLQRSLRSLGYEVYTKKEDLLRALGVK